MGDVPLPGIAVEDIGRSAYGIFKQGDALIGKTVGIVGESLTGAQMAEGLAKALGRPVRYNAVTPAHFRGFGFPGADDLGNMFQFKQEFAREFGAPRDPVAHARTRSGVADVCAMAAGARRGDPAGR